MEENWQEKHILLENAVRVKGENDQAGRSTEDVVFERPVFDLWIVFNSIEI